MNRPGAVSRDIGKRPHLTVFLPSLDGGGGERAMLTLAAGFAARGFRTHLVLARAKGPYLRFVPASVEVVDLGVQRMVSALLPLAAYLRRERPRALLAALHYANLAAMLASHAPGARTRTVVSIQSAISPEMQRTTSAREYVIPWLLGRLHKWADGIIAVSEGTADDAAHCVRIPRERIQVIYNPVITPGLLPAASEQPSHPWFNDGRPVVLGVGRLMLQKNFPALIDAFALVRREHNARLIILGEGPERCALEERVTAHGLQHHVALPGFMDNPYACMARSAVLVLSSYWEGLPTVLIESLALGTPVVSTDCPSGPREILRGGVLGTLVPTGDVPALARAISAALSRRPVPPPSDALRPYTLDTVLDQYQRVLELDA